MESLFTSLLQPASPQLNAKELDGVELDELAEAYMGVRERMWSLLAARVGGSWESLEQKCMKIGFENLHQAYETVQKNQGTLYGFDSGIGLIDWIDMPDNLSPTMPQSPTMDACTIFYLPEPPRAQVTEFTDPNPGEDNPNDSSQITSNDNPMSQPLTDNTDSYSTTHADDTASPVSELRSQKDFILDRLMVHFYDVFDNINSSYRQRHGTTETPSSHSRQSDLKSTSIQGKTKRKSTDVQDDDRDDEVADGSRKRPRKDDDPGELSQTETERKSFACPYFKHNPQKYRNHRSCQGPFGWDTISRLKEHIYRQHKLPPQCPRCCEAFKDEAQLKEHQRLSDACPLREQEPFEGLDKSQVDQLKGRKSMFRAGSEEEKWKIICLIIFPDTALNGLPSPYYDDKTTTEETNEDSPKAPGLAQYEAYMNRELPRKVRKELEIAIEKLTGPTEETLKNQLENLIRNCQERLSREFLQRRLPVAEEPQQHSTIEAPVDQTTTANWHSQQVATTEISAQSQCAETGCSDALAQYAVPSETPLGAWPFSWSSSDFSQTAFSDSGYFSNTSAALPSDPWWAPPAPFVSGSVEFATMLSDQDELLSRGDLESGLTHTRKEKERANSNAAVRELNHLPSI